MIMAPLRLHRVGSIEIWDNWDCKILFSVVRNCPAFFDNFYVYGKTFEDNWGQFS